MIRGILVGVVSVMLMTGLSGVGVPAGRDDIRLAAKGVPESIWTEEEWKKARTFSPLPPPPANPTNALSENEKAARFGHRLFFDARLSPKGFACASCHLPAMGFSDGKKVAHTIKPIHRNTMTILNAGQYRWLTWDGARDSLWNQASGPVESAEEMGSSRLHVIKTVMRHYGRELRELIEFPAGWDVLWPRLSDSGKPGDPGYDDLSPREKVAVNRVFSSILKIIAAYEMKIVSGNAPFDLFVAGDRTALSESAQRGFQLFLGKKCDICHNTPLFSDDEFHNVGVPSGPFNDKGRYEGLAKLKRAAFRGTGKYADGSPWIRPEDYKIAKASLGAFRTPSLRELRWTAPYGHNGSIATLAEFVRHYENVTGDKAGPFIGRLDPSLPEIKLSEKETREIVNFLHSLSSDYSSQWTKKPEGPRDAGKK